MLYLEEKNAKISLVLLNVSADIKPFIEKVKLRFVYKNQSIIEV